MAKLLKLRRGTTSQHSSFTGAEGEVTVDTDKETLVVHDGSTAGGHPVAAQDMANVPAGTILGTQLENSGVSAGQYGSSSAIPIVTVDAQGLVTAASTTSIDSTRIDNGTSNVRVNNNGNIVTTRSGTDRFTVTNSGVAVVGTLNASYATLNAVNPTLTFSDSDNNPDYTINVNSGILKITDSTNSTDRLVVNSDGHVDIGGNLDVGAGVDVTGNVAASGTIAANGGSIFITGTSPAVFFTDSDDNPDYYLQDQNGTFRLVDNTNSTELLTANATTLVSKVNHDFSAGLDVTGGNITSTGDIILTNSQPRIVFNDNNANPDYQIENVGGQFKIRDNTNSSDKLIVQADGHMDINSHLDCANGVDVTGLVTSEALLVTKSSGNASISVTSNDGIASLEVGGQTDCFIDLKTPASDDYDIRFVSNGYIYAKSDINLSPQSGNVINARRNLNALEGLDVTGNITVTGTVDGRDVASDGSKLDGIESGATADQSASEILTLIKTVDGSGSGLDADTLDGIDQSSFLRSDSGDTANGDITFGGGAGAITIGGNSDIRFNTGSWTGNSTKIQHHSNYLYIQSDQSGIILRGPTSDRWIVDGSGHFVPSGNNTYNIGNTSNRVANIYVNDFHLSNKGHSNEMDGTWGDWTIQEGESDLFLKNNRSGKKYKFNLTEVS